MSARIIPEPRLPNPNRQFRLSVDHGPFLMKHTFEYAELSDGTGFHEQGKERLRNEKTWSRIDDTSAPTERQPSHPRAKTLSE
jgi:hypothetical protein